MRHLCTRSATFVSFLALGALIAPRTAQATPSGANGKIAYSCGIQDADGNIVYQICSINPDGTGLTQLTFLAPGEGLNHTLAWSPDGTKIVFSAGKNTAPLAFDVPVSNIWLINADGSGLTQLTATSTDDQPAWSPDGKKITFTSFRNDLNLLADNTITRQVFVMNADGSDQQPITSPSSAAYDWQPAWSPDGSRIAFIHYGFDGVGLSYGYGEIWTVNPDGSHLTQLTVETDLAVEALPKDRPNWSPDGTSIVFTAWACCPDSPVALNPLWIVNADGTGERHLLQDQNLFTEDPAWSPDGTKFVFLCSIFNTPGSSAICVSNTDGSDMIRLDGPRVTYPDWQPLPASHDLNVTNCDDPQLAQVTSVDNLTVPGVAGCAVLNMDQLTNVGANIDVSGTAAITVNLGGVTNVGGNITVDGAGSTTLNLGNLYSAGGNIDVQATGTAVINLGNLYSAGGSIDVQAAGTAAVNLGNLHSTGGDLQVAGSTDVTVNLGNVTSVGGNLTLETAGSVDIDPSVAGTETLTSIGGDSVSAQTAAGTTDVSILGGVAAMRVVLPQGAFTDPVRFTLTRQGDAPPVPGTLIDGSPAQIDPIASYQFTFAIPTLNKDAALSFLVNLPLLDADTRSALVAGVEDDSATIFVKGDASDATPQAFSRCQAGQTPATDRCVDAMLLDANQQPVASPDAAVFASFAGFTGHFSSYGVALVTPTPRDTEAPAVTIALTSPNGGQPNGQNGWFVGTPVIGTVTADDRTTGGSPISAITCGTTAVSLSGVGTPAAAATFAITADGETSIACAATDAAGNTSAPVVAIVHVDAHAPLLAPTVSPNPVVLRATATAVPHASDATSGISAQSCGSPDTSTVGIHSVGCSATDVAGITATVSAPYNVVYSAFACLGGVGHQVLDPVAPDGSSVFKSGRTVPVKFRVCDATGASVGTPGVITDFRLVGIVKGTSLNTVSDLPESTTPDAAFRWDATDQQWMFNLSTKGLPTGATYVYDITLNDGTHIAFRFGVR
jgi:Tol biopolymer transport system component